MQRFSTPHVHVKLPKLTSFFHNLLFKRKNKSQKSEGWVIVPHGLAGDEEEDISRNISEKPDSTLDPSLRVRLDTTEPESPAENGPENNNHLTMMDDEEGQALTSDDAPPAANNSVDQSRPLSSQDPDVSSLDINKATPPKVDVRGVRSLDFLEKVDSTTRTFGPSVENSSGDAKPNVDECPEFPSQTIDLGNLTREALDVYIVNPGFDTPFQQFLHRQRVVEWRRYRARHIFMPPRHCQEYLVVKIQDAMETRFMYLNRLIHRKDTNLWHRCDADWLECVKNEGRLGPGINTRVTVTRSRRGQQDNRDFRLIWGLWTPCDRVMMLDDWPHNDVKREGHVFEPSHQPDLLDLFIAARMVHLDTSFSMFRRQDHWFAKMLSRVLNQKWDKNDQFSVADKNKFDLKRNWNKWYRLPISDVRHDEILKLREHCNNWREKLVGIVMADNKGTLEVGNSGNTIPAEVEDRTQLSKQISCGRDVVTADSYSRVTWAQKDRIHILLAAGPDAADVTITTAASASKQPPAKSILKKCTVVNLAPSTEEKQRDSVTPEPLDPEHPLYPVETILNLTNPTDLCVLIEAYKNVIACLEAAVSNGSYDNVWSLFRSIQKDKEAFVKAVLRDLEKALVDPLSEQEEPVPLSSNTPFRNKWHGLSVEQVKYARDWTITSHAVLRLLQFMFAQPVMMGLFNDMQLQSMFSAVLAITLTNVLPTPYASKTWGLAISIVLDQRLSAAVLTPTADRIASVLCRGISGELTDEENPVGFKAIHDLSVRLPAVFVPAFTHSLLSPLLTSLLAPHICIPAVHALGGFVIGLTSITNTWINTKILNTVLKYINTTSMASRTPTKPQQPSIFNTLRTILEENEPIHLEHRSLWAICVLSVLTVLLDQYAMYLPPLTTLIQLGLNHQNPNVRALTTVMWPCTIWVYLRPGSISVNEDEEAVKREMEREVKSREEWWKIVTSIVEMETGVCTIAALIGFTSTRVPLYDPSQSVVAQLSAEEREERPLRKALEVLCVMASKDALTRKSAIDTMRAMLGMPPLTREQDTQAREYRNEKTLIPRRLFSAMLELLTTESQASEIHKLSFGAFKAEDVRMLSKAEMQKTWVWEGVVKAWRTTLGAGKGEGGEKERLLEVWEGMVRMGLKAAIDSNNAEGDIDATSLLHDELATEFVDRATNVIIVHVLEDTELNLDPSPSPSRGGLTLTANKANKGGFSLSKSSASKFKLELAQDMWNVVCWVAPHSCIQHPAQRLTQCLMNNIEEYTTFGNPASTMVHNIPKGIKNQLQEVNKAWAEMCAATLAACGHKAMQAFWYGEDGTGTVGWRASERALVWRVFAKEWVVQNSDGRWEGAISMLAVPFCGSEYWTLTSEDADAWQKLLDFTITASLDHGHDSNTVLGMVVSYVVEKCAERYIPVHIRLVEFMLKHLAANAANGDLKELPEVLDFVTTTMCAAYPPPQDQTAYAGAACVMASLISQCPRELLAVLGETMSRALAVWLADAEDKWDKCIVEHNIVPLYRTLLNTIQIQASVPLLSAFGPALYAPFLRKTRAEIRDLAVDAFEEFWDTIHVDAEAEGWNSDIAPCLRSLYGALKKGGAKL